MTVTIRRCEPGDMAGLAGLYGDAFPAEDLLPLVRDLTTLGGSVLSLVAVDGGKIAGHVMFTRCAIEGREERAGLLGPLAVATPWQRQGIGSRLVREGFKAMAGEGIAAVLVLGDPAYYRRFGFAACDGLPPPYPLPEEWRGAWQVMWLDSAGPRPAGRLLLPDVWLKPALWAP